MSAAATRMMLRKALPHDPLGAECAARHEVECGNRVCLDWLATTLKQSNHSAPRVQLTSASRSSSWRSAKVRRFTDSRERPVPQPSTGEARSRSQSIARRHGAGRRIEVLLIGELFRAGVHIPLQSTRGQVTTHDRRILESYTQYGDQASLSAALLR